MMKEEPSVKKIVLYSIIIVLSLAYYAFLIAGNYLLPDNEIYLALNIGAQIELVAPEIIALRIISAAIIILTTSFMLRLILAQAMRLFKKGRALITLYKVYCRNNSNICRLINLGG